MSRTIKEIYNEAVQERNRRLELTEFASDSKQIGRASCRERVYRLV